MTRSIMDTHFSTLVTLKLIMLSLQNTSLLPTVNTIYSHFEIACKEIAAETIPLKHKTKRRIPWENLNIRNKRKILHEAAQQKDNNPTIENIRKTCNAQKELSHAYETV